MTSFRRFSKFGWTKALGALGVSLVVAAAASGQVDHKPGDLNDDGCVDNADFILLQASFGGTPPGPCGAAADIDQNGFVTAADLNEFANDYFLAPVA